MAPRSWKAILLRCPHRAAWVKDPLGGGLCCPCKQGREECHSTAAPCQSGPVLYISADRPSGRQFEPTAGSIQVCSLILHEDQPVVWLLKSKPSVGQLFRAFLPSYTQLKKKELAIEPQQLLAVSLLRLSGQTLRQPTRIPNRGDIRARLLLKKPTVASLRQSYSVDPASHRRSQALLSYSLTGLTRCPRLVPNNESSES